MFSKLDNTKSMKIVFQLSERLKEDPIDIAQTQALTLNTSKPNSGLKGSNGLFDSQEWWKNIEEGKIQLKYISGEIVKTYVAGQDNASADNSFELLLKDGSIYKESIYNNDKSSLKLFKIGATVEIVYALDELKRPSPTGEKNYLDIVLEMAVSVDTV